MAQLFFDHKNKVPLEISSWAERDTAIQKGGLPLPDLKIFGKKKICSIGRAKKYVSKRSWSHLQGQFPLSQTYRERRFWPLENTQQMARRSPGFSRQGHSCAGLSLCHPGLVNGALHLHINSLAWLICIYWPGGLPNLGQRETSSSLFWEAGHTFLVHWQLYRGIILSPWMWRTEQREMKTELSNWAPEAQVTSLLLLHMIIRVHFLPSQRVLEKPEGEGPCPQAWGFGLLPRPGLVGNPDIWAGTPASLQTHWGAEWSCTPIIPHATLVNVLSTQVNVTSPRLTCASFIY